MTKKFEETMVIRNNKLIYAVRLSNKIESEGSRIENCNPYIIVENGEIKFIDSLYGSKSEFNFTNDIHVVAKEIFISTLRSTIKKQILELKQLELVLSEMNLSECIGDTLCEGATVLQRIKRYIAN